MMRKLLLMAAMLLSISMSFAQAPTGDSKDEDAMYASDLLKAGEQAPDFTLKQADGRSYNLYSHAGNYKVIEFWASWCPDCRKDLPEVNALLNQYKGKNFSFIGVSFDTDKAAWVKCFSQTFKRTGMVEVSELKKWKETKISQSYHIRWIPSYYILDKQNKVVLATVEINKVAAKLKELSK